MREPIFKTRMTELFGIRHPILCGGLMWLADAEYVAAVVNAGGMGFITARSWGEDFGRFRAELQKCRNLTEGRPFGVNLYLSHIAERNAPMPRYIEVMAEEGVRFVETSGYLPAAYLPQLREAGMTVMHKAATLRHAAKAEALGVDAVCLVGAECGGHPGLDLTGSIVQACLAADRLDVPFAIGGGIGHGRQIAAVLAMGADAVLLGTRMTVASEIWAREEYKHRVVEADETDNRVVLSLLRNTYRVMDNETARKVAEIEMSGTTEYAAYEPYIDGRLARRAYETGDWNMGLLSMGQSAAFADAIEPVEAIYDRLVDEAKAALTRMQAVTL